MSCFLKSFKLFNVSAFIRLSEFSKPQLEPENISHKFPQELSAAKQVVLDVENCLILIKEIVI